MRLAFIVLILGVLVFDPGVATAPPSSYLNSYQTSSKRWLIPSGYSYGTAFSPSSFISYIKSRKEYHEISNFTGLASDNIYIYTGTLNLDQPIASQITSAAPILLIVEGDINLNTSSNTFGNPAQSLALVTDHTLNIDPSMTELNGLFIANFVNFGNSASELKIVGNVISSNPANPLVRTRADSSRPSVFIVVRANMYLDLLPYFSIATYEWRQLR